MRRRSRQLGKLAAEFILIILVAVLAGCGGNTSARNIAPGPTMGGTPAPGPSPTPSPGTSGTAQWQAAAMAPSPNADTSHGTIAVDTQGNVTVQVSGVQPNTNYPFQFCPFPGVVYKTCIDMASTLVTDGSGNGQVTFHFPQPGKWAGFFVSNISSSEHITTYDSSIASMTQYLQPMAGTNPSEACEPPGCTATTQDPLSSGSVSVSNMTAHIVINGAAPNTTYDVTTCGGGGGSSCYELTKVTTNASGNVTTDVQLFPNPATVFVFQRSGALGFITGFVVP